MLRYDFVPYLEDESILFLPFSFFGKDFSVIHRLVLNKKIIMNISHLEPKILYSTYKYMLCICINGDLDSLRNSRV